MLLCYCTSTSISEAPSDLVHSTLHSLISRGISVLQSKEGCCGNSALFKLRLTHLGDDSSLLTASWSHVLTDGELANQLLKHP